MRLVACRPTGKKIQNSCCYGLTSRVPDEGKSSVCLICMKYRIIIVIVIIISMGQTLLSYIANTSHTHARMHPRVHALTHVRVHTHRRRRTGYRYSLVPNREGPGGPRFAQGFRCFLAYTIFFRPTWDVNSWQDVLSVDMNRLRHLPRWSNKNCDLQFANIDRQT